MDNPQGFSWFVVPAFLAFALFWCGVVWVLGQLSGWPGLATQFRASARPVGTQLSGQVRSIGGISENNVTTVIVSPEGLYLSRLFLFSLGTPPLLVPWPQVALVAEKRFLWSRTYVLRLGGQTNVVVGKRAYGEMENYLAPFYAQSASITPT